MKKYFKSNGEPYYRYTLCYVYVLPHIGFNPKEYKYALKSIYCLKESFGPPGRYLGANVENLQLENGCIVWYTNRVNHLKSEIENINN